MGRSAPSIPRPSVRQAFLLLSLLLPSAGTAAPAPILDPHPLFDSPTPPLIELTVDGRDWEWLQANAKKEKAVPAELRLDGVEVGKVGLRYKGSYGSLYTCLGPDGRPKCPGMSLKIDFDHAEKGRRYLGLSTLNLQSTRNDASLMHERLAYEMFRLMGIPASRANYARVRVNGTPYGIYLMVEQVDRAFLKGRFQDPSGPLYKEAWPVSADAGYYADKEKDAPLKKREAKDPARHIPFVGFYEALAASDGKGASALLGRFLDLDTLMRYLAVDFAVRNYDGIMAFYCGGDAKKCGNHNYYWYHEPASGRFHLIPWDMTWTFQMSSTFNAVPDWKSADPDCERRYPTWGGEITVRTPACDPFFRVLAACDRDLYRRKLRDVLEGPLKEGVAEGWMEAWAARLGDAVAEEGGPGLEKFRNSIQKIQQDLSTIRVLIKAEMRGEPLAPMTLATEGVNDLEQVTGLQAMLGTDGMCNAGSSLVHGPNRKGPIEGKQDFRLDFVFRNESEGPEGAWKQWCMTGFQLKSESQGATLSGGWKLRLKVKADRERNLRVSLDSPRYVEDNVMNGITYGWETRVGTDVRTIELDLSSAAYPSWARVRPDVPLASVLGCVSGMRIHPAAEGRDSRGLYPPGVSDRGWVQVDDIEFVKP